MAKAIQTVKDGASMYKAATDTGIPKETLRRHLLGNKRVHPPGPSPSR